MSLLANAVVLLVAALHAGFFVLESVLWTAPTGRKVFRLSAEDAERTKTLASNQGVYNLMLTVGLAWGLYAQNPGLVTFLLAYVAVVGVYGAATVKPTVFFFQALPALVALGLRMIGG